MQIVRKKLSAQELDPPGTRYVALTDTVQTLIDGTWTDTPAADPRTNPGLEYPPRGGIDPVCLSAANMVAGVKHIIDEAVAAVTLVEMASLILALLGEVFPPLLLLASLVWALAEVIVGLTTIVVNAAFTTAVYDRMLCYFYENLQSDGSITAAGLETVREIITADEDPVVAGVIDAMFAVVGFVGVTNWGATGTATGDCTACLGCFQWNWAGSDEHADSSEYHIFNAGYPGGSPLQSACISGTNDINAALRLTRNGIALPLDHLEFDVDIVGASCDWYVYGLNSDNIVTPSGQTLLDSGTLAPGSYTFSVAAGADYYGTQFIFDITGCSGTNTIVWRTRAYSHSFATAGMTPNC